MLWSSEGLLCIADKNLDDGHLDNNWQRLTFIPCWQLTKYNIESKPLTTWHSYKVAHSLNLCFALQRNTKNGMEFFCRVAAISNVDKAVCKKVQKHRLLLCFELKSVSRSKLAAGWLTGVTQYCNNEWCWDQWPMLGSSGAVLVTTAPTHCSSPPTKPINRGQTQKLSFQTIKLPSS